MSESHDFEDPKIIQTASLLHQRDAIVMMINGGNASNALTAMATLITQFFIDDSETEMLKAKDELVQNTIRCTLPSASVMHYWDLINNYLNRTYLADFHKAKPKVKETGHI